MFKKFKFLLLALFALPLTLHANEAHNATVIEVYTHDCCGRGPYTLVTLEGGSRFGSESCGPNNNTKFAIETSHPNHNAFLSIGLSALMSGKKVNVYGNRGGCIGPFNRADGIIIKK